MVNCPVLIPEYLESDIDRDLPSPLSQRKTDRSNEKTRNDTVDPGKTLRASSASMTSNGGFARE